MPEKDEGLVTEFLEELDKDKQFYAIPPDTSILLYVCEKLLAKATPIIEKQQQEKDTAYYAEMMKEAIDRVRTETKKQEKARIREDILGGKPVGLTNDKGDMIFPTGYDIPANSFIYFVSQEGLQALKGE